MRLLAMVIAMTMALAGCTKEEPLGLAETAAVLNSFAGKNITFIRDSMKGIGKRPDDYREVPEGYMVMAWVYDLPDCSVKFYQGWAKAMPTNQDEPTLTKPHLVDIRYVPYVKWEGSGCGLIASRLKKQGPPDGRYEDPILPPKRGAGSST